MSLWQPGQHGGCDTPFAGVAGTHCWGGPQIHCWDAARGEALSVTMMGILLVIIFWGLVMLLFLSPFSAQPKAMDQAVQDLALALRNHLADPVMIAISQLSRWPVSLFSALALLLWLLGAGRKTAAVHWLFAIGGGALLHLLLSWSLRTTPQVLELMDLPFGGRVRR